MKRAAQIAVIVLACAGFWYAIKAIKTAFLDAQDRKEPCKALAIHDAYWRGRLDGDPARRIALNEACHPGSIKRSVEREAKKVVAAVVSAGEAVVKKTKKLSLDFARAVSAPIRNKVKSDFYNRHEAPHREEVAYVRVSSDPVSSEEKEHREKRFALVKQAQEKFLDMKLTDKEVLDISFSLSGGGLRAAFCGLGSLLGAEKIGLLDCVMTIGALSGGTWVLFSWLASGLEIEDYKERFISKWDRGLPVLSPFEIKMLIDDAILVPFSFEKDVTITDIWNGMLLSVLASELGNKRQRLTLSSLANKIGKPIPVGEAVWAGLGQERVFEFTPYEVGSRWLGSYIPTWGLGRKYNDGVSTNFSPEDALALGTFASAYAAQATVIADELLSAAPDFLKVPLKALLQTKLGELRVGFALVNNYTRGMSSSPINEADLPLADSGAEKILPLSVLYRGENGRHPDMIFAFDCGANLPGIELARTAQHATKVGLPLPALTVTAAAQSQALTVFADRTAAGAVDLAKPVFLYAPRVRDKELIARYRVENSRASTDFIDSDFDINECIQEGPCGTFNFNWSRDQAEKVIAQTELNVVANKAEIKRAMQEIVAAKRAIK